MSRRQGGRQYTQQSTSDELRSQKSSAGRPQKKAKLAKRALNAFAIAQHTSAETGAPNPRSSRLGLLENDSAKGKIGKRKRGGDNSDEEEVGDSNISDEPNKRLRRGVTDRSGNEIEGGSDSEGNEWITGAVPSDDDSSLNSDDAMASSDDERFQDFRFGGSSSRKSKQPKKLDLNEDDEQSALDSGEESEDFAAEAIDLADILDHDSEEEQEDDEEGDEAEDELVVSDGDDDANDPTKLSALQHLLSSMDAGEGKKRRSQVDLAQEAATPSEYGLNPKQKLSVADLLATVTDPTLRRSLKILAAGDDKKSKSTGVPGKLSAPLPKRQQDRIDRAAAFEKSKETLARWIETVKHNRQAEHLIFPLVDQDLEALKSTKRLLPSSKPANDLESTVQKILADSGLGDSGKNQDSEIQRIEELAASQMPVEEARARQAELRKARDLLFREEIRAKRIKKIKSKSYRRVHRKEREKNALRDRDALAEAGLLLSEDEQERMDRQRAEERMGQRHRESRWARAIKETGRAAWDDEARTGVAAMLKQDEELKRRMHGRQDEGSSDSDGPSSASDDEDDEVFARRMHEKLAQLSTDGFQPESKLSSMKFMKKAEAARRIMNNEAVEQLQREIDGISEQNEASDDNMGIGRRKFGPQSKVKPLIQPKNVRQDFEEGHDSDQEAIGKEDSDVDITVDASESTLNGTNSVAAKSVVKTREKIKAKSNKNGIQSLANASEPVAAGRALMSAQAKNVAEPGNEAREHPSSAYERHNDELEDEEANPFSNFKKKSKRSQVEPAIEISTVPVLHTSPSKSRQISKSATRLNDTADDGNSDDSFGGISPPPTLADKQALIEQAFAGDKDFVEQNFASEKKALAADEEPETIVSGGLPGWGSWVGPGLSKKEKRDARAWQASSTVISKSSEGVPSSKRKDKALEKVIISEKRVPKTAKYLASSLPHPFESRNQYERSLRLPMGPEFTTKSTFQGMTKPRVIVKGGIVAPMRKPLM